MIARDITLNIAVNLGRIARWTSEKRVARVPMFLEETENYFIDLERAPKAKVFVPTFEYFKKEFLRLKNTDDRDEDWTDDMFTWANILSHRAKLA